MKRTLIVFFTLLSQGLLAQTSSKIEFSYSPNGNRVSRQLIGGLVHRDTTVKQLPIGMDSLIIFAPESQDSTFAEESKLSKAENEVTQTWIGQKEVSIYPNPTQGYLTIGLQNIEEVKSCSIEIVDMNGSVVYQSSTAQRVYSVDLSNRANGNYYINLRVNGQMGSFVVVKQ